MNRVACAVLVAGCYTQAAPAEQAQRQPQREQPPVDDERRPPLRPWPADANVLEFVEGTVHTLRHCNATAPPVVIITTQTQGTPTRAVFAIAIELRHGPNDAVPRAIAVGGPAPSRCDPGCTGTVWIDTLQVGKRMTGRIDLAWDDHRVARQAFDYEWRGGRWDVAACPSGPDAYPTP